MLSIAYPKKPEYGKGKAHERFEGFLQ